ncbi:hypothetical protein DH2020_042209 [Rehmannia glutinosa]|uniref:J domain-containing protein n=1 Tax=Rehmannia glutinosa TaxID=99300 RepID=A0ABR0UNQ2_REHGL
MDESWRMRMGMPTAPPPPPPPTTTRHIPNYPPRRSTESHRRNPLSDDPLNPDDFSDVFGGPLELFSPANIPPASQLGHRRVSLTRRFSGLRRRRPSGGAGGACRNLGSRVKKSRGEHNNNGFYSDIFGWENERVVRSRSRSKASSSSVLSSEELSPLGRRFLVMGTTTFRFLLRNSVSECLEATWKSTHRHQQFLRFATRRAKNAKWRAKFREDSMDEEEDEAMSSYVIEINSDYYREGTCESNGVDEAIAWRKRSSKHRAGKRVNASCKNVGHINPPKVPVSFAFFRKICDTDIDYALLGGFYAEMLNGHQVSEGHTDSFGSLDQKWAAEEETQQFEYTILWPNSGWSAVHLMNITEIAQVKKAYQKARFCLHPDKLQQRVQQSHRNTLPRKFLCSSG